VLIDFRSGDADAGGPCTRPTARWSSPWRRPSDRQVAIGIIPDDIG
jgi:hypothetical protein